MEKQSSNQRIALGALGVLTVLAVGFSAIKLNDSGEQTMSKFTQANVTNLTAATAWQASDENPYRSKLGTYAIKTDAVVVAILRKGTTLSPAGFDVFLTSLNTGIANLAKKPAYANNTEVQNIIGYLLYELTDTSKTLAATNGAFFNDLAAVVTASNQAAATANTNSASNSTNTTSTTTTTTNPTPSTNIPAPSGSTQPVNTPSTQSTSTQTPGTCSGNVPSGTGVKTFGYTNITPGPVTLGTTWAFKGDTSQYGCTWECETGFDRDGNNGCKPKAAGTGNKIRVVDSANNNAGVAGVKVEVIHNLINATSTVGTYTTNSNGETPEFFIPEHIQQNFIIYGFTKDGMKITSGTGCQSRVTRGYNFCDAPTSKTITVAMGSDQASTLTLRDSSIAYGSVVGIISTVIEGAENGLLACTTPASNPTACDNPTTPLANQPGWSYDASAKKFSANIDVSGDGWPNQEYKTCLRNPGQAVQCFNFSARTASINQEVRFSSNDGSTIGSITGYVSNAGKNLLACTQLASSGECEPTTVLANQQGWSYNNGTYTVNLNVQGQGWPKTSYISCYKAAGQAKQCFTVAAQ